jgi:hypothetical protein
MGAALRALFALATMAGVLIGVSDRAGASRTVTASQWQAGYIISDAQFYNATTMNATQVQAFLNSMYTGCSTGYTCMRDYTMTVPTRAAETGLCNGITASPKQTAAQVIAQVAVSCGVNPQSLLVLIQKESGLLTSWTPDYAQVTGYGCPDSTGCNAQYYGFFNQVYLAARQFKLYRLYPDNYGYVAGRSNYILYNPNSSCGGTNVFILNQATAGLYDYTPYQPNAAALANLGGTGDNCSTYGNRNFWYFFNNWFGPTQAGNLVRSADSQTVYYSYGSYKYPIDSVATLNSLPPAFGAVLVADPTYLSQLTTGPTMGRMIRGPDGSIYFFDARIALHVPSCAMVAAYGYTCPNTIPMPAYQISQFYPGPALTQVYVTSSGRRYLITAGTRREVLDDQSLTAMNVPLRSVTLTDSAISALPLAVPVVRSDVAIQNRADASLSLNSMSALFPISASLYAQTPLSTNLPIAGQLDPASLALLTAGLPLTGFAVDPAGNGYVLTASGKDALPSATGWGVTFSAWPSDLLAAVPTEATASTPPLVKQASAATTYAVGQGARYPIASWGVATAITGSSNPPVVTMLDEEIAAVPTGPHPLLVPGTLVKSATDPSIYLVDGLTNRIHLQSFATATSLGLPSYAIVDSGLLGSYATAPGWVSPAVTCNGTNYLAYGGALRSIDATLQSYYALSFTPLDPLTCRALPPVGAALTTPVYLRAATATVYQLANGQRRPIANWAAMRAANGGRVPPITVFAAGQLDSVPIGPVIG